MAAEPESGTGGELFRLASQVIEHDGLELVELQLRGSGASRVLRVDIDRAGPRGVSIDDCQRVSRALSSALDTCELLPFAYCLQVSSPGVERPIRSADDIRRNTGRLVRVVTEDSEHGRRAFRGRLRGAEAGCLVLETATDSSLRLCLDSIVEARQDLPF